MTQFKKDDRIRATRDTGSLGGVSIPKGTVLTVVFEGDPTTAD